MNQTRCVLGLFVMDLTYKKSDSVKNFPNLIDASTHTSNVANWRQVDVSFPARPPNRFWNRDAPIPDVLACPALAAPWPLFCAAAN
jgi:hypothetical protein